MSQPVTVENFVRAETDTYAANIVSRGGLGQFVHRREPLRIEQQVIIRGNPDALVSQAVFDLDAGPVTVTLPDAKTRLMSLQFINQDHFTPAQVYAPTQYTMTREEAGSRYVVALVRVLVDPWRAGDLEAAHGLQDQVTVHQQSRGTDELPRWESESLKRIRDALIVLSKGLPETSRMFGKREDVDAIRHLIGAAYAWGGQPPEHAYYLNITPDQNDGQTVHRLTLDDVPVDGYWSVTVYNAQGYLEHNDLDVYTINTLNAKRSADGSIHIHFGSPDTAVDNCIPVMPGWNYLVRLYRARPEVINGQWKFPDALPVA